jgi:RNA polymerase sigma factor (sigma-70 family)
VAKFAAKSEANVRTFGGGGFKGHELIELALKMQEPEVMVEVLDENGHPTGKKVRDDNLTAQAINAQAKLKRKWVEFAKSAKSVALDRDGVRHVAPISEHLQYSYDEAFNSTVPLKYDGSHLTLPGSAPFVTGPWDKGGLGAHQRNAIWRAVLDGYAYLAHGVGAGKTSALIAIAMEWKRLGTAKKPLINVLNPTLHQFAERARIMYPNAKILVATKEDLQRENRRAFLARVRNNDWDVVIMAHSQFDLIPNNPKAEQEWIEKTIAELMEAIMSRIAEIGGDEKNFEKSTDRTVKDLVNMMKRLRTRLDSLLKENQANKDDAIFFDDLGFDALLIDEAHQYKKLPFVSEMQSVTGLDRQSSQRGTQLLMRLESIKARTGGRGVVLASGTPVTNTLGEVWNATRATVPESVLEEFGAHTFDGFMANFATVVKSEELNAAGNYVIRKRLAKFINGTGLAAFVRSAMDVQMSLELNQPEMVGGGMMPVKIKRTAELKRYMAYLGRAYAQWSALEGKEKMEYSYIPVVIAGAAKAAAIDIRLVQPGAVDDPDSKVNVMVKRAMELYRESSARKAVQLVFVDQGNQVKNDKLNDFLANEGPMRKEETVEEFLNDDGTTAEPEVITEFNIWDEIRKKLIAAGVPEGEIAVVNEAKTDEQRAALFARTNAGTVRFLIGSTAKLGTGVNVQERVYAMHHLDAPWTPAGLEQRTGRGWRNGNKHKDWGIPIHNLAYGVVDSLDSMRFELLETKAKFSKQALDGRAGVEFDDPAGGMADDAAQLKAEFTGNPWVGKRIKVLNQIRMFETDREGYDATRNQRILDTRRLRSDLERLNTALRESGAKAEAWRNYPQVSEAEIERLHQIHKEADKEFAKKSLIGYDPEREPMRTIWEAKVGTERVVFQLGGKKHDDGVRVKMFSKIVVIAENGEIPHEFGATSEGPRRLPEVLEKLSKIYQGLPDLYEVNIRSTRTALAGALRDVRRPWEHEREYALRRQELADVETAMRGYKEDGDEAGDALAAALAAPKTETPEFKQWFGKSQVVTEAGAPRVVYHGTNQVFDVFNGPTFFAATKKGAASYARERATTSGKHRVVPAYLSIQNMASPDIVEAIGWQVARNSDAIIQSDRDSYRVIEELKSRGYDGARFWDQDATTGLPIEAFIAFDPTQIKSAIANRGTFDPNNPSILAAARVEDPNQMELGVAEYSDLFRENQSLAEMIANKFANLRRADFDSQDIRQEALIGLSDAAQTWNPLSGVAFKSYAGAIIRHRLLNNFRYQHAQRRAAPTVSLQAPAGPDSDATLSDAIADTGSPDPALEVAASDIHTRLMAAVATLPPKQRRAIEGTLQGQNPTELAREFGVSGQAVGNLLNSAMANLRRVLKSGGVQLSDVLAAPQVETPEFRRWFGDSKVVDEQGKPLVVYHGTAEDFTIFEENTWSSPTGRGNRQGFYFTSNPDYASAFAKLKGFGRGGDVVMPVYLRIQNPFDATGLGNKQIDAKTLRAALENAGVTLTERFEKALNEYEALGESGKFWGWLRSNPAFFIQSLEGSGFDGVKLVEDNGPSEDSGIIYYAFNRNQIKSSIGNSGAFSLGRASVLESPGMEGDREAIDALVRAFNSKLTPQAVAALYNYAKTEAPGERTVGRPDLANPASGAGRVFVNAVDEARKPDLTRETQAQWEATGREMFERDPEGVKRMLLEKAADPDRNGLLTPEETKAARLVVASMAAKVASGDTTAVKEAAALTAAYRDLRSEAGRELAAGKDTDLTPLQRNQEFLMDLVFMPSGRKAAEIKAAPTAAEKSRQIAALKAEISELRNRPQADNSLVKAKLAELAKAQAQAVRSDLQAKYAREELAKVRAAIEKMGVTMEELMDPKSPVYLRLRGDRVIASFTDRLTDPEKRALRMFRNDEDIESITRATGLTAEQVNKVVDDFRADFIAKQKAKFLRGMKAEDVDLGRPAPAALPLAAPVTEAEALAEMERALKLMGFGKDPVERAARRKLAKRSRAKPRTPVTPTPTGSIPGEVQPVETGGQTLGTDRGTWGDRQLELGEDPNAVPGETAVPGTDGRQVGRDRSNWGNRQLELGEDPNAVPPPVVDISDTRTAAQLGRIIAQAKNEHSGFDMAQEYWLAGLLSGPKTQAANTFGNALSVGWEFTVQRMAEVTVNSMLRAFGKGDPRGARMSDVGVMAKTLGPALREAWDAALYTWGSEVPLFEAEALDRQVTWRDIEEGGKGELRPGAISGQTGRVIRMPLRLLLATDEFFKQAIGRMHAAVVAHRMALSEGLNGKALEKRVRDLLIPGSAAWVAAVDEAKRLTFQQPPVAGLPGAAYRAADKVRNEFKPARFVVPFLRTPFAIFSIGLRKSPLGLAYMANRAVADGLWRLNGKGEVIPEAWMRSYSSGEFVRHLAEQVLAWGATVLLLGAFEGDDDDREKEFVITGSRSSLPNERAQRDLLTRVGLPAYTVRMGRLQFQYARFEPIATVLGTTADAIRTAKLSPRLGGAAAAGAFTQAVMDQTTNKTFLQGLANISEVIRQPTGTTSQLADFVASWVPAILRAPIRDLDPYVRDRSPESAREDFAGNFVERVKTGIVPQTAPRKIDIYGREVTRGGNPIVRTFIPGEPRELSAPAPADRVLFAAMRQDPANAWAPMQPRRTLGSGENARYLDKATYVRYQRAAGRNLAAELGALPIENPRRPTPEDIEGMRRAATTARKTAREDLGMSTP